MKKFYFCLTFSFLLSIALSKANQQLEELYISSKDSAFSLSYAIKEARRDMLSAQERFEQLCSIFKEDFGSVDSIEDVIHVLDEILRRACEFSDREHQIALLSNALFTVTKAKILLAKLLEQQVVNTKENITLHELLEHQAVNTKEDITILKREITNELTDYWCSVFRLRCSIVMQ